MTNKDIADHVVPLISRDPDCVKFLREELGWNVEKPYTQKQVGKEVRHLDFYLAHRLGGMGFGPQFKVVRSLETMQSATKCKKRREKN